MAGNERPWARADGIEPTIDHGKCSYCKDCFEACPQEVYDIDYENRRMVVANPLECIVCLHCEEACPTGAVRIRNAIRKEWKAPPITDMWGWKGIKPPE